MGEDLSVLMYVLYFMSATPLLIALVIIWDMNSKWRYWKHGNKTMAVIEEVWTRSLGKVSHKMASFRTVDDHTFTLAVPIWYQPGRRLEVHELKGKHMVVSRIIFITEAVAVLILIGTFIGAFRMTAILHAHMPS